MEVQALATRPEPPGREPDSICIAFGNGRGATKRIFTTMRSDLVRMSSPFDLMLFASILAGYGLVSYWAGFAPEGWESEMGFHFGALPVGGDDWIGGSLAPFC